MTHVKTYVIIKKTYKIFCQTKIGKGDFIMSTINITNARKDLYHLVENVNLYSEPALIVSKNGNAVLISEDDWNAIQETLYLNSVPGMAESIVEAGKEPLEECSAYDPNEEW